MNHYRGEPPFTPSGIVAMIVTLIIWVGFLLSMRAQGQTSLTPTDVALIRFGIPALLFLPFLLLRYRSVPLPRCNRGYIPLLLLGGLPFFYLVSLGSHYAPAAHAGALIPGTAPLFVSGLAVLVFKEPLPRNRLLGLGLIMAGVAVLVGYSALDSAQNYWRGDLAFLGASFLWACYTIALRLIGIGAWEATTLLCAGSSVALLLLLSIDAVDSQLAMASWQELSVYVLLQGLGAGIIGGVSYGIAIRQLGAEKTAALGSFTPALAAVAAIPLLGETLETSTLAGVIIIMAGVALASGIRWQKTTSMHKLFQQ